MPGDLGWEAPRGITKSLGNAMGRTRERPESRAVIATDNLNGVRKRRSLYSKNRRRGTPAPGCAEMRLNANSPRSCCVDARQCFAT